jgi:hypothetical protein
MCKVTSKIVHVIVYEHNGNVLLEYKDHRCNVLYTAYVCSTDSLHPKLLFARFVVVPRITFLRKITAWLVRQRLSTVPFVACVWILNATNPKRENRFVIAGLEVEGTDYCSS